MQRFSLIHPRCGTAFLLWVMVIAIFVFAFFGRPPWYWLIATRILLLPVIAGIAYELIRFAGKHQDNTYVMALLAPGLWLQRLTTRQPTLDQIEVSIQALKDVLEREEQAAPGAGPRRSDGVGPPVPRIERIAEAVWQGRVASGSGTIAGRSSGAFDLAYSEPTRVGDPAGQTSPEELIAAAHAGCFAMSLAAELSKLQLRAAPPVRHRHVRDGRGRGQGASRRRLEPRRRGGRARARRGDLATTPSSAPTQAVRSRR